MRVRTILISVAGVVVAALGAAVVVIETTDFSKYRGVIEQKVRQATGRELTIGGEFQVELGLSPSLVVENVNFANASWGSRRDMAIIKRFEVQIDLLPLITGEIRVRQLRLIDANILLETDAKGLGNWEFDRTNGRPAPARARPADEARTSDIRLPEIHDVYIEGALLTFNDGETKTTKRFSLGHFQLTAENDAQPLHVDVNGTYNDFYFELTGTTGPVAQLSRRDTPYPLDATAKLGATATTVNVKGTFKDVLSGSGYDLQVGIATDEIAHAADFARDAHVAEFKLPPLGPLSAAATLTDTAPGGHPALSGLKLQAGRQDQILLRASGAVRDLERLKGVAVDATASGAQIAALSGLVFPGLPQGIPQVPPLGPYNLAVKATNGTGDRLSLPSVRLDLGRDDLLKVEVDGAIHDPLDGKGYGLAVTAHAADLSAVAREFKLESPLAGPLDLQGKIADAGPDRYALSGMKLQAAGSDIGGSATLSLAGTRPAIAADLASAMVDLAKLIPHKPPPAGGQAAPAPASAKSKPSDGRVFPADPLPFETLNAVDAELRYRADTIRTPQGASFRNTALQGTLRGGELNVQPLSTNIGGGSIAAVLSLAAKTGAAAFKVSAKDVDLGEIDKEVPGGTLVTGGKTNAEIDVRGSGQNVRALMAGANGGLMLSIATGTFTSRYADMLGFEGLEDLIGKSLPRQEVTNLNCLIGRFDISNGMATSRALVMDTRRLTLDGAGTIDLRSEGLDLNFDSTTKVTSLLSLMPPVHVGGTLADPDFTPDLAAGAVGAVGGLLGDVLQAPGNLLDAITGSKSVPENVCAIALAKATGRAAPAPARASSQSAPSQAAPSPGGQAQPQRNPQGSDPIQDLGEGIQRSLRGLFGR
jgi:uncharacterized protein involved in outer membrane biogenesis